MRIFIILAAVGAALARPEPPVHGGGDSYASASGFGGGSGGYSSGPRPQYGVPNQQNPVIQKHVYVNAPPPEPVYQAPRKPTDPPPPPLKHYKIVFIKAPTAPPPTLPDLPVILPQPEQKTLIYVLAKKPDELPEIVIPTPAPTQPSKPEVFFIKYKTKEEEGYGPAGVPVGESYGLSPRRRRHQPGTLPPQEAVPSTN